MLDNLVNLLFPKTCFSCEIRLLKNEKTICTKCENSLQFLSEMPLNNNFHFDKIVSLFQFNSVSRKLIHALKYDEIKIISQFFAEKFKIYYNYSISNFEFNSINAGDAGTLICAKCENITVKDLNLSNYNQNGLLFFNTSNSSISNVTISDNTYGLYLDLSSDNIISNITIENNENCLKLDESSRNYISNIICNFGMDGLSIGDSSTGEQALCSTAVAVLSIGNRLTVFGELASFFDTKISSSTLSYSITD